MDNERDTEVTTKENVSRLVILHTESGSLDDFVGSERPVGSDVVWRKSTAMSTIKITLYPRA